MEGVFFFDGQPLAIEVGGRRYTPPPITQSDFQEIQRQISKGQPDVVSQVVEATRGLPADEARALIEMAKAEAAAAKRISNEETMNFIASRPGLAYTLHRLLEKKYPGQVSIGDVDDFCTGVRHDEIELRLARSAPNRGKRKAIRT
jgi:hypothetical protein